MILNSIVSVRHFSSWLTLQQMFSDAVGIGMYFLQTQKLIVAEEFVIYIDVD
jgi:hypothetical protein